MRYLLLATPYVFLCSIWLTFRRFYTTSLDKSRQSDPQGFQRLRSSIQMQTVMGAAGIAIALAAGFSLGRLGMH
jgi:hypothetical protein